MVLLDISSNSHAVKPSAVGDSDVPWSKSIFICALVDKHVLIIASSKSILFNINLASGDRITISSVSPYST